MPMSVRDFMARISDRKLVVQHKKQVCPNALVALIINKRFLLATAFNASSKSASLSTFQYPISVEQLTQVLRTNPYNSRRLGHVYV